MRKARPTPARRAARSRSDQPPAQDAYEVAVRFLANRPRSVSEIERHLRGKRYECVGETIDESPDQQTVGIMVRVDLGQDKGRQFWGGDEFLQAVHRVAERQRVVMRPVSERDLGRVHHVDVEVEGYRAGALLESGSGFGGRLGRPVAQGGDRVTHHPALLEHAHLAGLDLVRVVPEEHDLVPVE